MNIPILIKSLYGEMTFTGLYSFEFQNKGKKVTEIFFMVPPKNKNMNESTRSTTNPTLSGNYNTDAGNATKTMSIKGELWFPTVGSPRNPVARDASDLDGLIDGLTEFFAMRWYLIRYRDYTMTKNSRMDIPVIPMNASPEVTALYKSVSKLVKNRSGALYDEIQLIVHDYDMDDHFYCRVSNFSSSQTDSKYLMIEYNIELECYQKYSVQTAKSPVIKKSLNEQVDLSNALLQSSSLSAQIANSSTLMAKK